jgi:hypothetical protein
MFMERERAKMRVFDRRQKLQFIVRHQTSAIDRSKGVEFVHLVHANQ